MRLKISICALLAGITLAIYWPIRHFDIIYFDDPDFVLSPNFAAGLNWDSFNWALKSVVVGNWHPVTTFSFLMTHQFFGTNPGVEHSINVLFHTANAVLLFLLLAQLTGATWRSAIVAGIFAWHPQHVESVAWIAERKDVLFMFFMLLALLCYAQYARAAVKNPKPEDWKQQAIVTRRRQLYYNLALGFFILSFMSKAMVVTLPILLLLLDVWPLKRFTSSNFRALLEEKAPFFALMFLFCALTVWVQARHGAVMAFKETGPTGRFENAILSYVFYLGQFFWPAKLALLYPLPRSFDHIQVLLALLLLLAISALCVLQFSRRPYLAVGWFWYLITMIPVIGLVQVGEAAMADRYTYLPLIGPLFGLVWLVSEWGEGKVFHKFLPPIAAVILITCAILTRRQVMFWKNDVTLFERTAEVTAGNALAQFPLAQGLQYEGHLQQAAVHYRMAISMEPATFHALANMNFADLLHQMGYYKEAAAHLETSLKLNPDSTVTMNDLAWTLATCPDAKIRDGTRAVQLAQRACDLTNYRETLFVGTLAAAYAEAGEFDVAVATAQNAIDLAQQQGDMESAQKNQELLQLYLAHKAYHEELNK